MSRAALLVLADGRFPAGGHAHSGGALPAASAPLLDITAEAHAAWAVRLFAS